MGHVHKGALPCAKYVPSLPALIDVWAPARAFKQVRDEELHRVWSLFLHLLGMNAPFWVCTPANADRQTLTHYMCPPVTWRPISIYVRRSGCEQQHIQPPAATPCFLRISTFALSNALLLL
eukprot:364577-Chlamydomonas_euryale.AAC.14